MTDEIEQPNAEAPDQKPEHSTMNQPEPAQQPAPETEHRNEQFKDNGASRASRFRDRSQRNIEGELLTLTSGEKFRVRRPSITNMVKTGQVPANVAGAALKFDSGKPMSDRDVTRLFELKEIVTTHSLLSPKIVENPNYEEDEIALSDLTEDEINDVYTYVQVGLEELTRFREKRQRDAAGPDSETVSGDEA